MAQSIEPQYLRFPFNSCITGPGCMQKGQDPFHAVAIFTLLKIQTVLTTSTPDWTDIPMFVQ
jgi:hypothetical protein